MCFLEILEMENQNGMYETRRTIMIDKMDVCGLCDGTGRMEDPHHGHSFRCSRCGGSGEIVASVSLSEKYNLTAPRIEKIMNEASKERLGQKGKQSADVKNELKLAVAPKDSMRNYRDQVLLLAPELTESDNRRDRIFALIDKAAQAKETAQNTTALQSKRDSAIHEIKYIAQRLLWELGA